MERIKLLSSFLLVTLSLNTTAQVQSTLFGQGALGTYYKANGNYAVQIGFQAGWQGNQYSHKNVFIGHKSGYTNKGSGNIFIGYNAGYSSGTTSNKLFIDNSSTNSPLIWGDFSANKIKINGSLEVTGGITGGGFNTSNWNTAYSWGNHASAGYYKSGNSVTFATVTATGSLRSTGIIRSDAGFEVDGNVVIDNNAGWHRSYGNTGWYNGTHGGGIFMQDNTWVRVYGNKSFYHNTGTMRTDGTFQVGPSGNRFYVDGSGNSALSGSFSAGGSITTSGNLRRTAHNTGHLEGSYNNVGANSTNSNPIYTIGSSYNPASTSLSNMYGVGYTHKNASFINTADLGVEPTNGWGAYVAADGNARIFFDASSGHGFFKGHVYTQNINARGTISASGGNSSNWNTAYTERGSQIAGTGLSWSGGKLNVTTPATDLDEQDLELTSNSLSLTNDPTPVDLSGYLDNTDNQQLNLSGNSLSLTNNATPVDLSAYLDNTDDQIASEVNFTSTSGLVSTEVNTALDELNNRINSNDGSRWVEDSGNIAFTTGQVTIGGLGTPKADYELSVAGEIVAEEVLIQFEGEWNWPDYVFSPSYDLLPIIDLKEYIAENKHLPNVPSAAEVNENGIEVGEMNKILLEKIEELTLYMIQQSDQIKAQSKELESLKEKVSELENKQ